MDWLRDRLLAEAKIAAADLKLVTITDSTDEACDFLLKCYTEQSWL
jgi:hypothetical protein